MNLKVNILFLLRCVAVQCRAQQKKEWFRNLAEKERQLFQRSSISTPTVNGSNGAAPFCRRGFLQHGQ